MSGYDIPVCLFVFRRLDTVKMIMSKLQIVKPQNIYIFADGAREGVEGEQEKVNSVREYIQESINWECESNLFFSDTNLGYAKNIRDGFGKVLTDNPYGIFIEDDAIPSGAFFTYCKYLLKKYRSNKKIQYIAGFNGIGDNNIIQNSYTFGTTAPMSGAIATWSDRWFGCDFTMREWAEDKKRKKIFHNTYDLEFYRFMAKSNDNVYVKPESEWDIQFDYDMRVKNRVAIVPRGNLANSFGYIDASHTQGDKAGRDMASYMSFTKRKFVFPMDEPAEIKVNEIYDKYRQYIFVKVNGNILERYANYLYVDIKDVAYKSLPSPIWNSIKSIYNCLNSVKK